MGGFRALKIDPKRVPKEHSKKIWIFNGFGRVLEGFGEDLGRILGGFWEAFGRVWEAIGHSWGLSELFFVVFAGGGCLLLFFTVFLLISEAFAELCWALLGFAGLCWALLPDTFSGMWLHAPTTVVVFGLGVACFNNSYT